MTSLDIYFDFEGSFASSVTVSDEAYEKILWIQDLTDLVRENELRNLAHWLGQLTNDVVAAARAAGDHYASEVTILSADVELSADRGGRSPAYNSILETILQIRELLKRVTPVDLGSLAYRLAKIANIVIFAADKFAQPQLTHFDSLQLHRRR